MKKTKVTIFLFPLLIALGMFLTRNETILVQAVTLLVVMVPSLIVTNDEKFHRNYLFRFLYDDENLSSLANIAITVAFGGAIIFIAENSTVKNEVDVIFWVISFGVWSILALFGIRNQNKLIGFFLKITLAISILGFAIPRHFGSQFIWIPVIGLCTIIFLWFEHTKMPEKLNKKKWISLFPIILGVISTIYQFWSVNLFLWVKLWTLLAFLAGILLIILFGLYLKNKIKERRIIKKKKEEEIRKETERKKKEAENLSTIESISKKENITWDDLFFVFNYFKSTYNIPQSILKKVSNLSLSGLITISNCKRKIVWRDDFKLALKIIDDIVYATYEDKEIKPLVTMVQNFLSQIEKADQFRGYQELEAEVMRHYVCKFLQ